MRTPRPTPQNSPQNSRRHARSTAGSLAAILTLATLVTTMVVTPRSVAADDQPEEPPTSEEPEEVDEVGVLDTSAFVAVTPCRLFDSRDRGRQVIPRITTNIAVGGECSTPIEARAAAVTITVTGAAAPGFLTAWGAGDRPASSNVNFGAGETVANSSIVPLDDLARMRISPDTSAHVIVDVAGVFVPAATSRSGRFEPLPLTRHADTRANGGPLLPGTTHTIPLPDTVPVDAVAITATVTVVDARRAGFVTAHPAGSTRPHTSISNLVAGQTRAASAVLPVSSGGVAIHVDGGGHVVLDVTGYFTGASAEPIADGLFVPVAPARLHDSRSPRRTLAGGGAREISVPTSASAWALNVTATDARRPGFVTAFPARTDPPDTSLVNIATEGAVSNSAIVPVTEYGLAVSTNTAVDVVVDGSGWFTGPPVAVTTGPAPDPIAAARVLVVGDSSAAGIRWNGATTALRGAQFTIDLESCRRLVRPSCSGREGRRPPTALAAVERHPYGRFDVLVIATGYNDEHVHLGAAIDLLVPAAQGRGMRTIVWLTYRERVGYQIPTGARTSYPLMNQELHRRASEAGIELLDWWEYTADAPHWFVDDGVHQTTAGSLGLADAISRALAAIEQRPCPMPWRVGEAREWPCPTPDPLPAERDGVPDVYALYPEVPRPVENDDPEGVDSSG